MRPLRLSLVGLALVLAVVSSGCARSGGAGDVGLRIVAGGAERTMEARTFRMSITVGEGEGPDLMSGAVDLGRDLGWLGQGEGDGVQPDQITVRDGFYGRSDLFVGLWGVETPWLFYDTKKMTEGYERARAEAIKAGDAGDASFPPSFFGDQTPSFIPGVPGTTGSGFEDPAALLGQIREHTEGVDEEAREDVRGVTTTRYRIRFDEARLRRQARADTARQLDKMTPDEREQYGDLLRDMADDPIPAMSVWVSDDGLVRRVDRTDVLVNDPGDDEELRYRIEFYDFGAPVTVTVPRPEDVTPVHTLPEAFEFGTEITIADPAEVSEWQATAEGAVAGVRWFLEEGTTPEDVRCLRLRTDPPLDEGAPSLEELGFPPGAEPPGFPEILEGLGRSDGHSLPEGLELPEGFELPDGFGIPEGLDPPDGAVPPASPPPGLAELADALAELPTFGSEAGTCDEGQASPVYGRFDRPGPVGYAYGRVPPRVDRAEARFVGERDPEPVPLHGQHWAVVFESGRRLESVHFLRGGRTVLRCERIFGESTAASASPQEPPPPPTC